LKERREAFSSLIILRRYAAPKIFLLGLLFPVVLCFSGGKWAAQGTNQIAHLVGNVFGALYIHTCQYNRCSRIEKEPVGAALPLLEKRRGCGGPFLNSI
jgi:hypothetical protein